MRWRRRGELGLLHGADEVDWGCQVAVTESTWFGGGGGVVVKAEAVVGFWVCKRERERDKKCLGGILGLRGRVRARERELGFGSLK